MKKTILFSLIPVAILLLILEITGRILYPFDPEKRAAILADRDLRNELSYFDANIIREYHTAKKSYAPFLGWIGAPNTDLPSIRTDRLGFRNDVVEPRRRNEFRILIVGGSSAWGLGASSNATTPAGYLQQMLDDAGQDTRFRVMNGAYPAWESRQEMIVAIEFLEYFDPDMVLALTGFNDLTGFAKLGAGFLALRTESRRLGKAVEDQIRPMNTLTALRKLAGSSGIWRLVVYAKEWRALQERKRRTVKGHYQYDPAVSDLGTARTVNRYEVINDLGARHGFQLVVALQPDLFSTGKTLSEEEAEILETQRARFVGIDETYLAYRRDFLAALRRMHDPKPIVVDLAPVFDTVTDPIFIDPAHYIDAGNRRIAAELAGVVLEATSSPTRSAP